MTLPTAAADWLASYWWNTEAQDLATRGRGKWITRFHYLVRHKLCVESREAFEEGPEAMRRWAEDPLYRVGPARGSASHFRTTETAGNTYIGPSLFYPAAPATTVPEKKQLTEAKEDVRMAHVAKFHLEAAEEMAKCVEAKRLLPDGVPARAEVDREHRLVMRTLRTRLEKERVDVERLVEFKASRPPIPSRRSSTAPTPASYSTIPRARWNSMSNSISDATPVASARTSAFSTYVPPAPPTLKYQFVPPQQPTNARVPRGWTDRNRSSWSSSWYTFR
jgi:hypothetical protein